MVSRRLLIALGSLWLLFAALPAQAAVTVTFWSHEFGREFPHAYFTLKGTPDGGGAAVDESYGFTARSISPAILMGTVKGKVEHPGRGYMKRSDARFALVLTDAQYVGLRMLIAEWTQQSDYNLNKRNCVHFVAEALRRSGLTVPERPDLMKKPRSFLTAVAAANVGRVTLVELTGRLYLAR